MNIRRALPLAASLLSGALWGACVVPASAQGIISEWGSVRAPPPPKLAKVTLEPATTALLVLDLAEQTCNARSRPRCPAMLPLVAKLLAHARAKHWTVIYSLGAASKTSDILKPVAMLGSEPVVTAGPDKFIGTNLEALLKGKGIETVVTVGSAAEGAVLETAASAAFRGFKVVVPVDGMASATLYGEQAVAWDLANAPQLSVRVKLSAIGMIE